MISTFRPGLRFALFWGMKAFILRAPRKYSLTWRSDIFLPAAARANSVFEARLAAALFLFAAKLQGAPFPALYGQAGTNLAERGIFC